MTSSEPTFLDDLQKRSERFMDEIAAQQKLGGVASIEEMYDAASLILSITVALNEKDKL